MYAARPFAVSFLSFPSLCPSFNHAQWTLPSLTLDMSLGKVIKKRHAVLQIPSSHRNYSDLFQADINSHSCCSVDFLLSVSLIFTMTLREAPEGIHSFSLCCSRKCLPQEEGDKYKLHTIWLIVTMAEHNV